MKKLYIHAVLLFTLPLALFAQDSVQEAQAIAMRQHPDLAVVNSPFHARFINAYSNKKAANPEFFDSTDWPVKLADEVTYKIEKGLLGGKAIQTEYRGSEVLAGQTFSYAKFVSIEMTLSENKRTDFFFVAHDSKPNTFRLTLTEDEVNQFTALLEKALAYHTVAEKNSVKSYSKPLGTIEKDSYTFARSATGVSYIAVISPQEPGKSFSFEQGHYIEMEGAAASLELLKVRADLQRENSENSKATEEHKRTTDSLFK